MQISNRIAGTATQDSLANLAARAAGRTSEDAVEATRPSAFTAGNHDPSDRVSLSVEALLILSASRDTQSLPALSEDERNNVVSQALEDREYKAFRHFREEGDMKSYYRAYIEYYDRLQPQDQSSPRYAGSRQIAVSALRSLAYAEKAMDDDTAGEAPAVIDTILASVDTLHRDVPQMAAATAGLRGAEAFHAIGASRATSMYLASF
ncbi:biotin biosynthesis protein BioC [Rhizobium sp. TRM96647]|uniref:biotin biosynthesis protein BioC n=1 Tax=unclassified Rhizobium TaxID=2613769 RepID=UPI0021E7927B|nr:MULTISPECIES: biotin biosynthesis protein BioC [unclassified Rhizobium]MCV3737737.1 biotin biosynthesis protein BioC [Rhizobium sp. TRM96647]MCV3759533.1 biotin biosynthesis protein BioC [Rhizobium sp. TRM96650]